MDDDTCGNTSKAQPITDWKRLRIITDEDIRAAIAADPNVKPTEEAFLEDARVVIRAPGKP
jgi:hypothetical protein